jgi:hypothetical protein
MGNSVDLQHPPFVRFPGSFQLSLGCFTCRGLIRQVGKAYGNDSGLTPAWVRSASVCWSTPILVL